MAWEARRLGRGPQVASASAGASGSASGSVEPEVVWQVTSG